MRSRVPAPQKGFANHWIVRPMAQVGFERAALNQIVARAAGEMRQGAFAAFGVDKEVRRVRTFIDGWAPKFHEPDWLGFRAPRGGRCGSHAARPIIMRQRPETAHILGAEYPRFVVGAIRDWRPDLRRAV